MKISEWHMLVFVGASLIHDYWLIFGLPRIYYWDAKKQMEMREEDSKNIA